MVLRLLLSLALLTSVQMAFSQGVVKGKVTDEFGQPVAYVAISVQNQPTMGCNTDLDGNYQIKFPDNTPRTLIVQYLGYHKVAFEISVSEGEVVVRDIDLIPEDVEIGPAIVEGKAKKSNDNYMDKMKQKAPVTMDYISQATIRRTGDSNVRDAVRRV
ncbi:MAG: carboxypeptidase-like regulatory domain-containing protein, partial [Flavobacteriales bacterium]|nr:carboxypeptidase-like regulatory domain-containing protein [Flavobacteriales bacterium]